MSGHLDIHAQLEDRLAELLGYESCLVFGSGFLTNMGVISSLAEPRDLICFYRLDHASLIDGFRLSGARWKRFRHNDVEDLGRLLEKDGNAPGRKFIFIDSVFSMDGDIAPLEDIHALACEYGACLIVDEAHAVGIFGPQGSGVCRERGLQPDLVTGTFSKSFGGYGGFVACSADLREWLINKARPFIFSTGLPPASVAGSLKVIEILGEEDGLGGRLLEKAQFFHELLQQEGFRLLPFQSQILPVIVGEN
jgi:7-keto-8-aminopelargonate synthetase-like enzyme